MAEKASWGIEVALPGGPAIRTKRPLESKGFDRMVADIPGADPGNPGTVTVNVQPSPQQDVDLLLISSSQYGPELKYDVTGGGASGVVLDGPQLFVGTGMIGLLGTAPKKIKFFNGLGANNDASITIVVGRQPA